jgi:hypothetical protein
VTHTPTATPTATATPTNTPTNVPTADSSPGFNGICRTPVVLPLLKMNATKLHH